MSDETERCWGELRPEDVSHCFKPWFSEAAILDGMPAGQFSLVFDGDPLPELSSEIFEEVKHDVAYQLAVERYLRHTHSLVPLRNWRQYDCYLSEEMPRALKDLIWGESSFICCNFDTGYAWDEEEFLDRFFGLSEHEITSKWYICRSTRPKPRGCYETLPPLPSWYDIRFSQILPATPDSRRPKRRPKPLDLQVGYNSG